MRFNILMLVYAQVMMPIAFLAHLVNESPHSQLELLLSTLIVVLYSLFIFFAGRWDWFGYGLRFILLLSVSAGIIVSWYANIHLPFWGSLDQTGYIEIIIDLGLVLIFLFLLAKVLRGLRPPDDTVNFSFPLRGGTYYVAHGGSDVILNYHYNRPAQRYALDIVKLNAFGLRATGLYPKVLRRYLIFDDSVYSPVAGMVLRTVNDLPDLTPPERDSEARAGNHVVIQPFGQDYYVLLAHLRKGTIRVREGERVQSGQLLGSIGNSGNTTEPHLHIHCATLVDEDFLSSGRGKAILFSGRYLVRNSLVRTNTRQTETKVPVADEQNDTPERRSRTGTCG